MNTNKIWTLVMSQLNQPIDPKKIFLIKQNSEFKISVLFKISPLPPKNRNLYPHEPKSQCLIDII